jgi:hypothetical protein
MRSVTAGRARWGWGLTGLATMLVLAWPGFRFFITTGSSQQGPAPTGVTRTMTIPQPVTSLTVQSYGGSVQVTGGNVSRATVSVTYAVPSPGQAPSSVDATVHNGALTVGSAQCTMTVFCSGFVVTVPRDVTVTVSSSNGPVTVSGVAGVDADSDGGAIDLHDIGGPVDVNTDNGPLRLTHVTGPVQADTDGGAVTASGVSAADVTISSGGGPVQLDGTAGRLYVATDGGPADVSLSAAPDTVTIETDGGPATLAVPGGPYAVTTQNGGGPQSVTIPTSPAATRSITVITTGGPLHISGW